MLHSRLWTTRERTKARRTARLRLLRCATQHPLRKPRLRRRLPVIQWLPGLAGIADGQYFSTGLSLGFRKPGAWRAVSEVISVSPVRNLISRV